MSTVISVEHLSKAYQLGQIGTGTLTNDLRVWWARKRGKPNPLMRIGAPANDGGAEGTVWALRDVSIKVEQGEVLGIIGRNGAGKSTLLKVLSRITAPTSGRVKLRGRVASLLEVGTGFHPELTGRENIYLNGSIMGMSRKEIDRKHSEIVNFAEIEKFIDTPVKRYSSGMYVRLAFAVAAHLEPEILLVDEVLAVGDAAFQRKCLGKMGEVAREGRTVLFVSHNMGAIGRLCTRGIMLDSGTLAFDGSTDGATEHYRGAVVPARSWEPDLNHDSPLRIEFAHILDKEDRKCSRFAMGEPVTVEISAIGTKTLYSSHIHVLVRFNGAVLFRSFDTDDNPDLLSSRPPKQYHYYVRMDTRLWKPGLYEVSLDTGVQNRSPFEKYTDVLAFDVYDPAGDFDRAWSAGREGILRAPVVWEQL